MRLNIVFLILLTAATLASGIVLREFEPARGGDALARGSILGAAALFGIAVLLLARIVSRVDDLREAAKGAQR